mmetsp:Transcript_2282/g.6489  ORF Transcript_2282/g.6489 Transcript_2282/m.6489 type:complete len:250 (-) Transcript_2282:139-888(-)
MRRRRRRAGGRVGRGRRGDADVGEELARAVVAERRLPVVAVLFEQGPVRDALLLELARGVVEIAPVHAVLLRRELQQRRRAVRELEVGVAAAAQDPGRRAAWGAVRARRRARRRVEAVLVLHGLEARLKPVKVDDVVVAEDVRAPGGYVAPALGVRRDPLRLGRRLRLAVLGDAGALGHAPKRGDDVGRRQRFESRGALRPRRRRRHERARGRRQGKQRGAAKHVCAGWSPWLRLYVSTHACLHLFRRP